MKNLITFAGAAVCALAFASLLHAHAEGPDPRNTGAPGDSALACASPGCHVGTPLNGGGGSVQVQFAGGLTYTPGQQQMLTVVVSDPKARVYGFQLTARLSSDPANGQAGGFTAGARELVLCDNGHSKGPAGCPADSSVEFIEHSAPGNGTWQVAWTPPATNVGDVYIYVAGNGANGDGENTGDHIYTAHYTLSAVAPTGHPPAITSSGVVSASAFNPQAGVTPGTWLEIFGSNIASVSRPWAGPDFNGAQAPSNLNGVSVTIDGLPAYVDYVSATQVNVQVPDSTSTGPVQLIVTNADGSSNAVTVQMAALAPALLAPASFSGSGKQYVVAQFTDGTYVAPAGLINGLNTRPAKAGDIVIMYGIGFGPVTPANRSGVVTGQANTLSAAPIILFGQTPVDLSAKGSYYGLAPGFLGLYQFNLKVPAGPTGAVPVSVTVNGVAVNQKLYIALQ